MIALLSPAKSLDMDSPCQEVNATQPELLDQSQYLIGKLKKLTAGQIGEMMKISPDLAGLNHNRFQQWSTPFTDKNSKPALLAFRGNVYQGLAAQRFDGKDLAYAQEHVRILSGLYGLLKPLDLMQAYRLEMGTRWKVTPKQTNLYKYWGNTITDKINEASGDEPIINLASNEYFKAINKKELKGEIITCHFQDLKNGEYKSIMTYAKLGRGYMTHFMVKNKIEKAEDLKNFNLKNYGYNDQLSSKNDWVFTRDEVEL